eukprot:GHVT01065338.1.p2 GENE.GHVT01065338.1~~GHVT01065338.1.p2  ORF type:complete len:124 (-),score=11.06 GHVT01065338.1:1539-1910(-)
MKVIIGAGVAAGFLTVGLAISLALAWKISRKNKKDISKEESLMEMPEEKCDSFPFPLTRFTSKFHSTTKGISYENSTATAKGSRVSRNSTNVTKQDKSQHTTERSHSNVVGENAVGVENKSKN